VLFTIIIGSIVGYYVDKNKKEQGK
jgi:hypothetical protein